MDDLKSTILWKKLNSFEDDNAKYLSQNILKLANESSTRMKLVLKYFPEYTLHDHVHSLNVVALMSLILGDVIEELNYLEISILILSAIFHDIGMVPSPEEYASLEKNDKFLLFRDRWIVEHQNYKEIQESANEINISEEKRRINHKKLVELDAVIISDYLRENHAYNSGEYIRNEYSSDKRLEVFGINLSEIIAKTCVSHGLQSEELIPAKGFYYDEQVGTESINLSYLAIILRLADILDFDRERTPAILYDSIHFTNKISISEWEKHRGVKGWSIGKNKIRFTMKFHHPVYENVARKFLDWIDKELSEGLFLCNQFPSKFSYYKILLPNKVDRTRVGPLNDSYVYYDLEFSLSRNEIVNLLMTNNLYNSPSLSIRELLQNSTDAIRLRKAQFKEAGLDWKKGKIQFEHLTEDGVEVLKCTDNGTGMDEFIIQNFFTKVGRSFYKSPDFQQQRLSLKKSNADFEPCSQFGIGFMSCFMIGDKIKVLTRKDYGHGIEKGKPLIIDINGTGGLISIRNGDPSQPIGTSIYIYGRKKPSFFDKWTDKVRLITTLSGYALGIEFPIEAKCSINEIKENILIKPELAAYPTFLEKAGISSLKEIKIDFHTINENLRGELKETFLINEKGIPCLSNEQASWEPQKTNNRSSINISITKNDNEKVERHYNDFISICSDGVLVAGKPGKAGCDKIKMSMLGWQNSNIYTHGSCLLDIRGEIKPELTPARVPVPMNFDKLTPKWERIKSYVHSASGQIWNNLSRLIDENEFTSETFFRLGIIYSSSLLDMNYQDFFKNVRLPLTSKNNKTQWKSRNNIEKLIIKREDKDFNLVTPNNCKVEINKSLKQWEDMCTSRSSLNWQLKSIIALNSKLTFDGENFVFLNNLQLDNKSMNSDCFSYGPFLNAYSTIYGSELNKFLSIKTGIKTYNRNHPLAKMIKAGKYHSKKTDLQEFAQTFVPNISEHINDTTIDNIFSPSRWFKYLGHKYFAVNWRKYPAEYSSPYIILVDGKEIEINEQHFSKWRDIKIAE